MSDLGGISCGEVLARLGDILDDELTDHDRRRITEHVAGCANCARFGERFREVVRALREADVSPAIAAALDLSLRSRGS